MSDGKIGGQCPHCNGSIIIDLLMDGSYSRRTHGHCEGLYWILHSKNGTRTMTDIDFRKFFDVDNDTLAVHRKAPKTPEEKYAHYINEMLAESEQQKIIKDMMEDFRLETVAYGSAVWGQERQDKVQELMSQFFETVKTFEEWSDKPKKSHLTLVKDE